MLALRKLTLGDMDAAAVVHRASFDDAPPWLAGLMLNLWTFQRNRRARRFYELNGFAAVRETDGSSSEEKEPDVLYRWQRT